MFAAIENIHHGFDRGFTLLLLFPVFRFGDIFSQPQGKDNRQNADEEQRPPAPLRHHQAVDLGRHHRTDGEARNQKAAGFITQVFWPAFDNISRAGTVLPRHPHPDHQPGDEHGGVPLSQTARQGAHGKENNTAHHRQAATVAIAHRAQHQPAEPAGDKGGGDQARGMQGGQAEFGFYVG